jgi:hypothetical protein
MARYKAEQDKSARRWKPYLSFYGAGAIVVATTQSGWRLSALKSIFYLHTIERVFRFYGAGSIAVATYNHWN